MVYCLFSNAVPVKNLNVNNGLSHIDVTCVVQDKNGFIWIGTGIGLQRYDGYELKSYHNENNSLETAVRIKSIQLIDDLLWITSKNSLLCFHTKQEKYLLVKANAELKNKSVFIKPHPTKENELCLLIDSKFYFATYNLNHKYIKLNLDNVELTNFPNKKPAQIFEHNSNQSFWFANQSHIHQYYLENNRFSRVNRYGSNKIHSLKFDSANNSLWIVSPVEIRKFIYEGTDPNLNLTVKETNKVRKDLGITVSPVLTFNKTAGKIWIGTARNGLFKVSQVFPEINILENYHTQSKTITLSANGIHDVFISKDNCMWLSLDNGGLDIIDLNYKQFHSINKFELADYNEIYQLKSVIAIFKDMNDAILWIGTKNQGVFYYAPEMTYAQPITTTNTIIPSALKNIISIDRIDNNLIIAASYGLSVFNLKNNRLTFYSRGQENNFNYTKNIRSISCDSRGLWISYIKGDFQRLAISNTGAIKLVGHYSGIPGSSPPRLFNKITNIIDDTVKNELILTDEKLIHKINYNKDYTLTNTTSYILKPDGQSLNHNVTLWQTQKQNDSTYWVGSIGNGLLKVILNNKIDSAGFGNSKCSSYFKNRIPNGNHIQSVLIDGEKNIWLASHGISQFNPKTNKVRNFDYGDGLNSNGFIVKSAYKDDNGKMYFGNPHGLVHFHPDSIQINSNEPQLAISNIIVNQRVIKNGEIIKGNILFNGNKLILKHSQNNFAIEFCALHFANPGKNKYKYKLVGYDNDWIFTDSKLRRANYSNLKFGNYTFWVNGTNNDGVWSDKPLQVNVTIKTPLWRTKVAYLLYLAIVFIIITAIYNYNIRLVKLRHNLQLLEVENEKKEEIHQTKLRFFTNISHELKTPLNLIYSPIELLSKNKNLSEVERNQFYSLITKNINRVLKLVNELMEFRKVETGNASLQLTQCNPVSFVKDITEMFRDAVVNKNIRLETNFPSTSEFLLLDTDKISKIIYNLLSNALKYSNEGGIIKVSVYYSYSIENASYANRFSIKNSAEANNYIYFIVKDNGIGISKDTITQIFDRYYQVEDTDFEKHIGSGIGLALTKSLTLAHKGDIFVSSEKNNGTEFMVRVPSDVDFYKDFPEIEIKQQKPKDTIFNMDIAALVASEESAVIEDKLAIINENKHNLLIVEDNAELRNFLSNNLKDTYNIFTASNGKKACNILEENIINIVISDIAMPEMDGYELTNFIKSNIKFCHIPLVLLTAKNSTDEKVKGVDLGADLYIAKPFSFEFLSKSIENIFTRQKLLLEQYRSNYTANTTSIAQNNRDKEFLTKVEKLIEKLMVKDDFKLTDLYKNFGMSRTPFYNKIKTLTGLSPNELVKTVRLKKAAQMLNNLDTEISEVVFKTGFQSQSYFSKVFKQEFGCTPSEFIEKNKS